MRIRGSDHRAVMQMIADQVGFKALARHYARPERAYDNMIHWRKRNHIPSKHWQELSRYLMREGHVLIEEDLKLIPFGAAEDDTGR